MCFASLPRIGLILAALAASPSPAAPRLVSTSPQLTELLFQLGKGADIVATPSGSTHPAAASRIPVLGSLFFPSIERTLRASADWVLLDELNLNPDYERAVRATGSKSMRVRLERVTDVVVEARRLLKEVYGESESPVLARAERCLAGLEAMAAGPDFVALVWLEPPILASRQAFLSSLISLTGSRNLAPSGWKLPYLRVSREWLMVNRPGRVYFLSEDPAAAHALRRAAEIWWPATVPELVVLHPDRFARSTLTPLAHLDTLGVKAGKECRELAP